MAFYQSWSVCELKLQTWQLPRMTITTASKKIRRNSIEELGHLLHLEIRNSVLLRRPLPENFGRWKVGNEVFEFVQWQQANFEGNLQWASKIAPISIQVSNFPQCVHF